MIIKIDNRETTLIPLIEKRFEIFMNPNTKIEDIHEGVDDGIEEDGVSNSSNKNKSVFKNKKTKETKTSHVKSSSGNGCLVPLHIFSEVEMDVTKEVTLSKQGDGKHSIKKEQLAIGDIILEDDKGEVIIIFERKTLYDLAASIRDGRYNEQSFRLDKENIHNHNILYIIEGDIERYIEKKGRVSFTKNLTCLHLLTLLYNRLEVNAGVLVGLLEFGQIVCFQIVIEANQLVIFAANAADDNLVGINRLHYTVILCVDQYP